MFISFKSIMDVLFVTVVLPVSLYKRALRNRLSCRIGVTGSDGMSISFKQNRDFMVEDES